MKNNCNKTVGKYSTKHYTKEYTLAIVTAIVPWCSMFKRNGVWWTCIRHEGRKLQKSLETSDKKLAQSIEAKIRTELVEGKYLDKPKEDFVTVSELLEQYLEEHSYPNKAPKSHRDDTSFSKRLRKYFGKMNLAQVRPRDIADYIKQRRHTA